MTKLTTKALRLYDKKGLLEPAIKDPINKYRYYAIDQIETGIKIQMLVSMGFGIDETKMVLDAASRGKTDFLQEAFAKRHTEIQLEIQRLSKIEEIISSNNPMELLYMQCTEPVVKETPQLRVISKREYGSYELTIGKLIRDLMSEIQLPTNLSNHAHIVGPIMFLSHDDDYKESNADIEVAIPISGKISISDENIEIRNIKPSTVISSIFTGPYQDIGVGYSKILQYINSRRYVVQTPFREIYLNDPQTVSIEELMTEIQIPVIRSGGE